MARPTGHRKAVAPGDQRQSGAAAQENGRLGARRHCRASHKKLRRVGRTGEGRVSGGPRGGGGGIRVGGGWKKLRSGVRRKRGRAVGLGAAGVPCAARGRRREEESQTETRLSGCQGAH